MLPVIIAAMILVGLTVVVHALGLAIVLQSLKRSWSTPPARLWPVASTLIRTAMALLVISLVEVAIWALFYVWRGCLPDAESAFYFSGVTYTSIGYGDVTLAKPWRILAPVEGLIGILMCGLSAGLFFAVVSRIHSVRADRKRHHESPS